MAHKSWQMNHVLATTPLPFLTSATPFLPTEQQGTVNLKWRIQYLLKSWIPSSHYTTTNSWVECRGQLRCQPIYNALNFPDF
jgi:hypothetical protein